MYSCVICMCLYTHSHFSTNGELLSFQCCCLVAQLTSLYDPMDCSPPGSSVHGISHHKKGCHFFLWGIFLTQGSDLCLLQVSCIAGRFFTAEPPGKDLVVLRAMKSKKQLQEYLRNSLRVPWQGPRKPLEEKHS